MAKYVNTLEWALWIASAGFWMMILSGVLTRLYLISGGGSGGAYLFLAWPALWLTLFVEILSLLGLYLLGVIVVVVSLIQAIQTPKSSLVLVIYVYLASMLAGLAIDYYTSTSKMGLVIMLKVTFIPWF